MHATLAAGMLAIIGDAACAQPTNQITKGLESCSQAARLASAICSNVKSDPVRQLDCFQKVREAQLECLEHVLAGTSDGSATPEIPIPGPVSPRMGH
jgi:hypothetical protein